MQQITNTIVMIRPISFRTNEQTSVNNYFQKISDSLSAEEVNKYAVREFNMLVEKLKSIGVHVIEIDDSNDFDTPDALFPNNWISFHQNGNVGLYPMFAENRRLERREDVLDLLEENGFEIENIVDYTSAEEEDLFLEGTGSIVLDRVHRKAFCAISSRSDEDLFIEFCEDFEFTPVLFTANHTVGEDRVPIYHTNVMLSICETFAILCAESIDDKKERKNVINHLKEAGKELILISEEQVSCFAGNMLQVIGNNNESYVIMSSIAYKSLTAHQIESIEKHTKIVHSSLSTIESCGGGSARCMMAEVFLPKIN